MSDSSSDGEPMLSSPEASDNENASNDAFKFTARKFQKVNERDSPPSATRRRRRHQVDAVKEKLGLIEREEQAREQKLRDRLHRGEDSSDDEDDVLAGGRASKGSAASSDIVEILDAPPNKANQQPHINTSINIDSDDSDDDAKPAHVLKHAPKAVLEVLQRSHMATYRLKQAQEYHAEDVHVRVQEAPLETTLRACPVAPQPAQRPKPPKLGKALRLSCRCQMKVNGKKHPTSTEEKTIIIHQNQPLSSFMEKVMTAYSLPPTARVTLSFDGINLDLKRTPASYEIEDEDLIDVTAVVIAIPQSASVAVAGPKFKLTLRSKNGKNMQETQMLLGKNEHFQNLMDQYRSKENIQGKYYFSFDGQTLNLHRTPANYEMEDGDLIDVIRS